MTGLGIAMFVVGAAALLFAVIVVRRGPRTQASGDVFDRTTLREDIRPDPIAGALDHLDEGLVVLDAALTPVVANASARRILGMDEESLPPRVTSQEVHSIARRALADGEDVESTLNLRAAGRHLFVRAIPLEDRDGVVLLARDITTEHVTQQLRRQFVANASHELKTPVASLQALAEAVSEASASDPEAAARFGRQLAQEAERLGNLIKDLLDLSRVEDPAALSAEPVELGPLVDAQVAEMKPHADAKRVELITELEGGVRVVGDDAQLELMVRNLVDNAIRYTPENGHVHVGVRREDGDAVVEVADDGIGIPLRAQARVFERFFRVDEDRARAGGGTGLGLSIVKNVAESHGGSVGITSELDAGSTFTVRIPARDGGGE